MGNIGHGNMKFWVSPVWVSKFFRDLLFWEQSPWVSNFWVSCVWVLKYMGIKWYGNSLLGYQIIGYQVFGYQNTCVSSGMGTVSMGIKRHGVQIFGYHHPNTILTRMLDLQHKIDCDILDASEGAIIMIQHTEVPSTTNILVKQQESAISRNDSQEEDEESTSTSFKPVSKINFKKSFCPVFLKKSFDSDSLLGLATESGSESIACDSAIENEANNIVDNIFQDNIENAEKENSETFLVSANSDKVVALKDFAFGNQENFFWQNNMTITMGL